MGVFLGVVIGPKNATSNAYAACVAMFDSQGLGRQRREISDPHPVTDRGFFYARSFRISPGACYGSRGFTLRRGMREGASRKKIQQRKAQGIADRPYWPTAAGLPEISMG